MRNGVKCPKSDKMQKGEYKGVQQDLLSFYRGWWGPQGRGSRRRDPHGRTPWEDPSQTMYMAYIGVLCINSPIYRLFRAIWALYRPNIAYLWLYWPIYPKTTPFWLVHEKGPFLGSLSINHPKRVLFHELAKKGWFQGIQANIGPDRQNRPKYGQNSIKQGKKGVFYA